MADVKLKIAGYTLDVPFDDFKSLSLIISAADIKVSEVNAGAETRQGSFSRTFILPATSENNRAFAFLYDTNASPSATEAVRGKIDAQLIVDGMPLPKGFIRVRTVVQDDKPKSYEVNYFSDNNDWFEKLSDVNLRDIETFTTELTDLNILTKQSTGTDITYPLINYGSFRRELAPNAYQATDFRPAIFIKYLLQRIFASIDYKVESDWLDTEYSSLIIPFTGSDDIAEVDDKFKFKVGRATTGLFFSGSSGVFNEQITFDFEGGSYFDDPTGQGTNNYSNFTHNVLQSGIQSYNFNFDLEFNGAGNANNSFYDFAVFEIEVVRERAGVSTILQSIDLLTNNSRINQINGTLPGGFQVVPFEVSSEEFDLRDGDKITFRLNADVLMTTFAGSSLLFTIRIQPSTLTEPLIGFVENVLSSQLSYGSKFNVSDTLPDRGCIDFIKDLASTFNLYFLADPALQTIRIEPRNTWIDSDGNAKGGFFYEKTSAVDWSDKLDVSRDVEINFYEGYKQNLAFKYEEDGSDGFLEEYNERQDDNYGDLTFALGQQFNRGEIELNNGFSATFYTYYQIDTEDTNTTKGILMPRLFREAVDADQEISFDFNTRLLMYERQPDYTNQFGSIVQYSYATQTVPLAPVLTSTNVPRAWFVDYDRLEKPQLHYAGVRGIGLAERFYKQLLSDIKNGFLYSAEFYLRPVDIAQLDLRKPVHVNGSYYYINKIDGYTPHLDTVTRVELIKISSDVIDSVEPVIQERRANNLGRRSDLDLAIYTDDGDLISYQDGRGNHGLVTIDVNRFGADKLIDGYKEG